MTPESERPVESAWADRIRDDPQVASLYRFGQRQMEMAQIHGKRVEELEAERETLRAALATSQAREATLLAFVERTRDELGHARILSSVQRVLKLVLVLHEEARALMVDPSPASDALGRVARAGVAYRALLLPNAPEVDAELIRRHHAFKAAVDELLVVAPHWGEPQGGGG